MPKTRGYLLEPEAIATSALAFLASDPERIGRFLALSGLDPQNIRAASRSRSFLPSVLDHVMSDERLLIEFAQAENLPPEAVGAARATLRKEEAT